MKTKLENTLRAFLISILCLDCVVSKYCNKIFLHWAISKLMDKKTTSLILIPNKQTNKNYQHI